MIRFIGIVSFPPNDAAQAPAPNGNRCLWPTRHVAPVACSGLFDDDASLVAP